MGYLRLALAIAVMAAHCTSRHSMLASCAVWIFYLLSGYLMTLLCDGSYQGRRRAFWASRMLRIVPVYWAAMFATTAGLFVWGHSAAFPLISLPGLPQILMLNASGWGGTFDGALAVPPAWTLTVELFWWALISLGAMDGRRSLGWMVAGAMLTIPGAYPLGPLWFSLWGGMLPFSMGAWLFQNGLVIPRDGRWGAIAGALSYPVYIIHYSVGAAVAGLWGLSIGWPLFWASLPATLAISIALVLLVERPIDRYRKQFRNRKET